MDFIETPRMIVILHFSNKFEIRDEFCVLHLKGTRLTGRTGLQVGSKTKVPIPNEFLNLQPLTIVDLYRETCFLCIETHHP